MKIIGEDSGLKKEVYDLKKEILEKKISHLFGQLKDVSVFKKLKKEVSRKNQSISQGRN